MMRQIKIDGQIFKTDFDILDSNGNQMEKGAEIKIPQKWKKLGYNEYDVLLMLEENAKGK